MREASAAAPGIFVNPKAEDCRTKQWSKSSPTCAVVRRVGIESVRWPRWFPIRWHPSRLLLAQRAVHPPPDLWSGPWRRRFPTPGCARELLQRGGVRQFVGRAQFAPQTRTDGQKLQHSPARCFQIGAQDQTRHQLPLGKVMAAAGGAIVGQVSGPKTLRQSCDALDQWRCWFWRLHADPIVAILPSFKKRFLQSKMGSREVPPSDRSAEGRWRPGHR